MLHTSKSCYISLWVEWHDLQILGNTDEIKWLSESDTCAVLCLVTGLRGSQDRHGSANVQLDILTWISCLPLARTLASWHNPQVATCSLNHKASNILLTVTNITKKGLQEPPRWNLIEDDHHVCRTCRKYKEATLRILWVVFVTTLLRLQVHF